MPEGPSRHSLLFADARTPFEDADFVIFGVPFDRTTSFRSGARGGPNSVREASWNFEAFMMEYQKDISDLRIADMGNTPEFGSSSAMHKGVHEFAQRIVQKGKFPLAIGGEHSISPGIVSCFKDVGLISIDAHLDFRDEYLEDPYSHACQARRSGEHLGFSRVLPVGIRSASAEESEDAKRLKLHYLSVYELRRGGDVVKQVEEAVDELDVNRFYLTLDMDAIDPGFAPAVGNPEPFGLSPWEVKGIITLLADRLVGLDITEVTPIYDQGNTSGLAARLAREAIMAASLTR